MPQELSPAVRNFQELKAREKASAIYRSRLRDQIRTANPTATPKQIEQIIAGHFKAARSIG